MERKSQYTAAELMGENGDGAGFGQEYASLPIGNMLMLDRITLVNDDGGKYGKGKVIAELDIKPDLWFFDCHFRGDPVMPGCLGLDALWQLLGFFMSWAGTKGKGRALGVNEVRFRGEIMPESKLVRYELDIKKFMKGRLNLAMADGTVSVDGQEIYTASALRVGLFDPSDRAERVTLD